MIIKNGKVVCVEWQNIEYSTGYDSLLLMLQHPKRWHAAVIEVRFNNGSYLPRIWNLTKDNYTVFNETDNLYSAKKEIYKHLDEYNFSYDPKLISLL